jgi:hypothetical protein
MAEKAHATILDRLNPPSQVEKNFAPQLELLTQMTNYASNLIPRAYGSSPKQLEDIIVCYAMLKQFTSMLDAVEVLVRAGAVYAAFLQARTAFEVSLYIAWVLVADAKRKAAHYYVGNIRESRLWALRVSKGTAEGSAFLKDMGQLGVDILSQGPSLDADSAKHISETNTILSRPEFAQINADFDALQAKGRRGHEPHWYQVLGKSSIRAIAKELQHLPDYVIYYGKGSQVVHSGSFSDHFHFVTRGAEASTVRTLNDLPTLLNFVCGNAILTFRSVLGFYRNAELPEFGRMYVQEWRGAFVNIPGVNTVVGQPMDSKKE